MYTKKELFKLAGFEPKTKADFCKGEIVYNNYVIACQNGNSGGFGNAMEILRRRPKSNKLTVAGHGKADMTFKLDGKLKECECKTNGGRIDDIKHGGYIVYSLNMHNSVGNVDISARIMTTDSFLSAIYQFKAVKEVRHNGVVDGLAIQPSKRDFWRWLEGQLEFNREWEYFTEDFE